MMTRNLTVLAFATLLAAVAFATATPADARYRVAPADEYFGRMKMSTLGIDNTIRDTGIRESYNPELASRLLNGLLDAEDALRDWSRKYPQDNWIPKRAYDLSHLLWRTHTNEGNAAADRCRGLLFRLFPKSRWAGIARHETEMAVAPRPGAAPAPTQQQILPPKYP
ncbi:MAG TPA: hypothetical protein VN934_02520 [Candidatus Tumulicola sp.]|nr:hypothetical protein [Candidatus Tumulicola sp.]